MTATTPVKLNSKFQPLFNRPEGVRYYILTGGRFSQKSFATGAAAATLAYNQGHRVLYSRYTLVSAKDSIIPEVVEKLEMLNIDEFANIQNDRITFNHNDGKIVFKGIKTSSGNQTAKLKSLKNFSCFILDEAEEENDEASFDKINLSIRAKDVDNIVIIILNPTTKQHWIYKRFFESTGVQPGWNGVKDNVCHIHTTYKDAIEFVPEDYLHELKLLEQRNPEKFEHIILGGWLEAAEGVVFRNWEYGKFDDSLPYGWRMDFGFFPDPDVLVKVAIDRKNLIIYAKQGMWGHNHGTRELYDKVKSVVKAKEAIVADSSEKRLIADMKGLGLNIRKVVKGDGSVLAGIKTMQDYKIVVSPESTEIGKELNNYAWKANGVPIDAYNHWIDAIRYYVQTFVNPSRLGGGNKAL